MNGWIKLHRQLLESSCYLDKNPMTLKVWITCLLRANHSVSTVLRAGREVEIGPGQFLYSRTKWAETLETTPSRVRNAIQKLDELCMISDTEKDNNADNKKDKRLPTIYQINNWKSYQDKDKSLDNSSDIEMDKKWTKSGQKVDTSKNERIKESPLPPKGSGVFALSEQALGRFAEEMPNVDMHAAYRFVQNDAPATVSNSEAYFRKRLETLKAGGLLPKKREEYFLMLEGKQFKTEAEYERYLTSNS